MEHLNVRLLLANAVKSGRWISQTILQKSCSFKSFSILEENCAADIIYATIKWKTFVGKRCKKRPLSKSYLPTKTLFFQVFQHFRKKIVLPTSLMKHFNVRLLLANAVKRSRWVIYTFLQKRCSFKSFSILEENCATDIINETFKCNTFVGKGCKKRPLSKLYLPTKASFFQVFQHFRKKKCAANINNGTFKCNTFVGKCCKKRPLSKLYLPTKALFFQVFQHFRRKLWFWHH